MTPAQELEAKQCLTECVARIAAGEHEATIRSIFTSRLRGIAGSPTPWWANEHIVRTEAALKSTRGTRLVTGFADNLVGLTAIEYEKNLNSAPLFAEGKRQVLDYMAGVLNAGAPVTSVRGVLSDTVRWYAFEVSAIRLGAVVGNLAGTDLTVVPTATLPMAECSAADLAAARQLHQFLTHHLGRNGGQILAAEQLCEILGVGSFSGGQFVVEAESIVDTAFANNPGYAGMVQNLWANFVSFVATTNGARTFDKAAYVQELYLLTLAKVVAANVVNGGALVSSQTQLQAILDGSHFQALGLTNLVEYDYFGWLTEPVQSSPLLHLAQKIQVELQAFDFTYLLPEDLFGRLVSQMAERTQRLLLGQEPTPGWLVREIVDAVQADLPALDDWQFVDPCCGSGAFVVEVVARRAAVPGFNLLPREIRGKGLCEVMTGFDLDPLAVMFAKVAWLIAAKPALQPFNGAYPTSIPIYHADSLFAVTPLARSVGLSASGDFSLNLDGQAVTLPHALTASSNQSFFDEYVEGLYALAQVKATTTSVPACAADVHPILTAAETSTGTSLAAGDVPAGMAFGVAFVDALSDLQRRGRNGLWLHMLKNGYRPALVRGRFNGVLTNFPWLALSKLIDNPYRDALQSRTTEYGIQPLAQSAPHLELATIFLLHSAKHYLGPTGLVAAIVPNSVIQGSQHEPLRSGVFRFGANGIPLEFTKVWDIDRKAFSTTNVAAVLFGKKGATCPALVGAYVSEVRKVSYPLHLSTLKHRNAWTKVLVNATGAVAHKFAQGADVMPRTAWMHEISQVSGPGGQQMAAIAPIASAGSSLRHLVSKAKGCKSFRATATAVRADWTFAVLISAYLIQFYVNEPPLAVLPVLRRQGGNRMIQPVSAVSLATDRPASAHFARVFGALASAPDGWKLAAVDSAVTHKKLNHRGKLASQKFVPGATLVVYGAGGTYPCAAKFDITSANADHIVIDQTVYWSVESDADKADFLVGLINSPALAAAIRPFQPVGMNGPRHIHDLPPMVMPPWDPVNPLHQDVVRTTRDLTYDLAALIAVSPNLSAVVNTPTADLDGRRTEVRKAMQSLPSYAAYETACALVV
jgi:hypothetical protein